MCAVEKKKPLSNELIVRIVFYTLRSPSQLTNLALFAAAISQQLYFITQLLYNQRNHSVCRMKDRCSSKTQINNQRSSRAKPTGIT